MGVDKRCEISDQLYFPIVMIIILISPGIIPYPYFTDETTEIPKG